jgi:hypothetical protein
VTVFQRFSVKPLENEPDGDHRAGNTVAMQKNLDEGTRAIFRRFGEGRRHIVEDRTEPTLRFLGVLAPVTQSANDSLLTVVGRRRLSFRSQAAALRADVAAMGKKIGELLDRVVEAASDNLVRAYKG